jgi:hypothetical protein
MFSGTSNDVVRILGEPATKETCVILEGFKPLGGRTNNKLKANTLQRSKNVKGGV